MPTPPPPADFTPERAAAFAKLALKGLSKEYPNKPAVVLNGSAEVEPPRKLHPAFYGCFDWHSAVHGHWMLARVLRLFPDLPDAKTIRAALTEHLTAENVAAEVAVFNRPNNTSFERPYGWAWLLKLALEVRGWDDPDARTWAKALAPLASLLVTRYAEFFPKQTYPIRSGVHSNTAFGLTFAHDYAAGVRNGAFRNALEAIARRYYLADADAPARWEPDGADFLSPSLCEADLMRRAVPADVFAVWLEKYLPGIARGEPAGLFRPATVTDRADPQLVHLDGLNLSRAWCMRGIASALPAGDPRRAVLAAAAARHAAAGLEHVASGDYAGEHWLASFAVHLLSTPAPD